MFRKAESFNHPLYNWDVGNVTNMDNMFLFAKSFNHPLYNWDVGNVDEELFDHQHYQIHYDD